MHFPQISVIIPVKNGALTLDKCLASIRNQTITNIDIVVLDSNSTDESREIAGRYNATVIHIPGGSFNHGITRNKGVQYAAGLFLFYTVQDAWLAENDALENMARHFEDETIMGVCGHQAVPHEKDKNPVLWFKRFTEPVPVIKELTNNKQLKDLPIFQQRSLMAWDNVVAMYRKIALIQQPFAATEYAEDWIWSRDALNRGWRLVYDPSIVVYHYHHQAYQYAYKVAYAVNYHFFTFFNLLPGVPPLILPTLKAAYHLSKHDQLTFKEKGYWILHNFMGRLGTFNSHIDFLLHRLMGGKNVIEKRYKKICKVLPQGSIKQAIV